MKYQLFDNICKVETFKIDYEKNFNNLHVLEVLAKENFVPITNISKLIANTLLAKFAKEYGFQIGVPKNLFKHLETNKTWIVDSNFDILDPTMCVSPIHYYLLADLYQLVLGNHAPNVQLIKFDDKIALGVEFIDHFESLKETNKVCQSDSALEEFPNCLDTTFSNYYTIAALTIITGDADLHEGNLGIIDPISSPTLLAKIDHDRNICDKNISLQDKILKSIGSTYLNKNFINNLGCIAEGISHLDSIPHNLWRETINRRWEKLEEIKFLMDVQTQTYLKFIEYLKNDLLKIKDQLINFESTLRLEHFILQNDADNLNNYLFYQNININKEYEFVGLNYNPFNFSFFDKVSPPILTPLEYAVSRGKLNICEYLQIQVQHSQSPESFCRINNNIDLIDINEYCITVF